MPDTPDRWLAGAIAGGCIGFLLGVLVCAAAVLGVMVR